ncbi:hypothetical protein [Lacticaseibacillus hulanensis]|jgi:hypothetical protein|uniref:hypothetical protein n=1 Tax=Lacticaseibacillus hulanensis TaxID=2493111 RepID=UPI0013E33416|nr:hypothetical protein [Lacticaseibacillus hulanensis]
MEPKNLKRVLLVVIILLALIPLSLIIRSFQYGTGKGLLAILVLAIVLVAYYFMSKPRN